MRQQVRHRVGTAALVGFAVFVGLVAAAIVTLNLHILVGLEQGYAASPAEVFGHSVALGVFDVLLALTAPVATVAGVLWLRRQSEQSRQR